MNILLRMGSGRGFILALLCRFARRIKLTRRGVVIGIAVVQQMKRK